MTSSPRRNPASLSVLAIFLLLYSSPQAWDGARKGLTLRSDIGVGYMLMLAHGVVDGKDQKSYTDNHVPLATSTAIGFGFTDKLAASFAVESALNLPGLVLHNVSGLCFTLYAHPAAPCFFTDLMAGWSSWVYPTDLGASEFSPGFGVGAMAGVGYEFRHHIVVRLHLTFGRPHIRQVVDKAEILNDGSGGYDIVDYGTVSVDDVLNLWAVRLTLGVVGY